MKMPWQRSPLSGLGVLGKLFLVAYGFYKIYEGQLLNWSIPDIVLGVALAAGGSYWLYRSFASVRAMRAKIAAHPRRVIWVYEQSVRVTRLNVGGETYYALTVAFDDGTSSAWPLSQSLAKDPQLGAAIAAHFPNARFGYSEELRAAYVAMTSRPTPSAALAR
jgi:hypothetical protein